jgi:SAM-dependent methyltransferase
MVGSFARYLLSKQSVDDRALNKDVLAQFQAHLPSEPFSIVEVGAGIGTMLARLLRWDVVSNASYTLVDHMPENIAYGQKYLRQWAERNGFHLHQLEPATVNLLDATRTVEVRYIQADIFDYTAQNPAPADVLVAHAVLDLLPLPECLPELLSLTSGLAWLTLVFDGVTTFEPVIDPYLDRKIEWLYHLSMDSRSSGGESRSGRRMFEYLEQVGASILAAGSSDWVVYPQEGRYPGDEAYFLKFILDFFEDSLEDHPDLDRGELSRWLQTRRDQIARGELVYIARQLDFLVRV